MKNKAVTPTSLKTRSAQALATKATEVQAVRLAADITAREAEAAKKRANGAKLKFKSVKKAWKQARKAAKRAAKRAKQACEKLTALTKKLKLSKKKTAAKPVIRPAEAQRRAGEFAVLIVSDSMLEQAHTDANELVCTHYGHNQQRFIKGLNLVSLRYQTGEVALPIAAELVAKTVPVFNAKTQQTSYQSAFAKNKYVQQVLRVAQQQIAYRSLLADSGYASAENRALVRALGHDFLFALESSRTVALSAEARAAGQFQAVQTLVFPDKQPQRVYLRSVQAAVLVTRQVFTNQDGCQGTL